MPVAAIAGLQGHDRLAVAMRRVAAHDILMFRGQDRGSIGAAKLMLGHPHARPDAIVRVNPELSAEFAALDDASIMEQLSGVANDQARDHLPKINDIFFDIEREPFIPFHKQVPSHDG